jgi:hypothetical protein
MAARLGVDRDAGHRQPLQVTAGRPLTDFELHGQFVGRHPATGLQDEERRHQSICSHFSILAHKQAKGWPLIGRTLVTSTTSAPPKPEEMERHHAWTRPPRQQ